MNKDILLFISIVSALASQSALANPPRLLTSYQEISQALKNGHEIKALFDLEKCESGSPAKMKTLLNIRGGMTFKYFIDTIVPETGKKVIKSSSNNLFRSYVIPGFHQLYTELQAFEDGIVHVYGAFVNPSTYLAVAEVNYQCRLSVDNNDTGIKVFDLS